MGFASVNQGIPAVTAPDDLDKAVTRTAHAVADLDSVTARIHHRIATPKPT